MSAWAIKWTADSPLDGHVEHLEGGARFSRPEEFAGYTLMVFATKASAQRHIRQHYGYIAKRQDLRRPPFCWRMPKAVRVTITIAEIAA